ncbi:GIY-YIG nuclease family protein [Nannocystaceae bacterium ST9]
MLLGEDGAGPLAYIGETEDVSKRLQNHVTKKDFWRQAVFVTSKDDNLTKAHVKYIESRFLNLAAEAERIRLENGKSSEQPTLPKPDRDAMEEYILSARILLSALGFPYLEKITESTVIKPSHASPENTGIVGLKLTMKVTKTGVDATGAVTDEGFVVFSGSRGSAKVLDSLPAGWRAIRDEDLAAGVLTETASGVEFTRDRLFTSPSAAASVLAGGNRNGREAWSAADGRTLKEIEEAQSETEPTVTTAAEPDESDD